MPTNSPLGLDFGSTVYYYPQITSGSYDAATLAHSTVSLHGARNIFERDLNNNNAAVNNILQAAKLSTGDFHIQYEDDIGNLLVYGQPATQAKPEYIALYSLKLLVQSGNSINDTTFRFIKEVVNRATTTYPSSAATDQQIVGVIRSIDITNYPGMNGLSLGGSEGTDNAGENSGTTPDTTPTPKKYWTYVPNWGSQPDCTDAYALNCLNVYNMLKSTATKVGDGFTANLAFIAPIARGANYAGPVTITDECNGGLAFTDIWGDLQPRRSWGSDPLPTKPNLGVENVNAINPGDASYPGYTCPENTAGLAPIFEGPYGQNLGVYGRMKQLKSEVPTSKIGISIGGWSRSDAFKYIANDDNLLNNFVNSIKSLNSIYNFDTIDIDWEFPGKIGNEAGGFNNWAQNYVTPNRVGTTLVSDKDNFTKLITKLKTSFPDKAITAAVSPSLDAINNIDYAAIKDKISYILLMSYDINGAWNSKTGHNAPLFSNDGSLSIDAAVKAILSTGFPKEKLVLGIPFYGRSFPDAASSAVGSASTASTSDTSISYRDIKASKLGQPGFQRYWDDVGKVPYLYNSNTKEWISYDDQSSVACKMKYAWDNELAGVMSWQAYQDNNLELTDIIANNLDSPGSLQYTDLGY